MKTLALVTCFLTISFAVDPPVTQLYNYYASCIKEFNVQEWTPEVCKCVMEKYKVIDEQGSINKEKVFFNIDKLISDPAKLKKTKDIITTCLQQAQSGSNDEKTMSFIRCAIHVTELFDKPE
ncbi:uncharacterized protein LOC112639415 [Camponotus floridanus]|uniref:uncharacterized protein LOC112639415 n=1 Tax=Camponotus floridanus TaxID=104421 RepID=UPI000DC6B6FD|nr:uncharacterized protein LOC112639415 [Camponotus floridanus]